MYRLHQLLGKYVHRRYSTGHLVFVSWTRFIQYCFVPGSQSVSAGVKRLDHLFNAHTLHFHLKPKSCGVLRGLMKRNHEKKNYIYFFSFSFVFYRGLLEDKSASSPMSCDNGTVVWAHISFYFHFSIGQKWDLSNPSTEVTQLNSVQTAGPIVTTPHLGGRNLKLFAWNEDVKTWPGYKCWKLSVIWTF